MKKCSKFFSYLFFLIEIVFLSSGQASASRILLEELLSGSGKLWRQSRFHFYYSPKYFYSQKSLLKESTHMSPKMTKTLTGDPTLVESGFDDPPSNPLVLLNKWLQTADKLGVNEPKGISLSTVDGYGRPSSRVVLLKDCDERGVIFGTSQESAKGKDLEVNPWAAGTLWWRETVQQVNFQGRVVKLSPEISDQMFGERTRDAQAIAVISKQSAVLDDESELRSKVSQLVSTGEKILRPKGWHGYHLAIESIEFWHGSKDRFHKRLRYDLIDKSWNYKRLQP